MAMHKAIKPFGWYPDGFTREALEIGDERDFGDVADGLVAAKMIAPVEASADTHAEVAVKAAEPEAAVAVGETTAEQSDVPELNEDGAPVESESDEVEDDQPKRRGRSRK